MRRGRGFVYLDESGRRVSDRQILDRIHSLAIPPAWTSVWICGSDVGHLQATGRDQRGRKQAIYHPEFRAHREETKFERLKDFGLALPLIRRHVEHDLRRRGTPKEKVVAVLVHLLEATLIRVGNRRYALENASRGLTTLQNRHLEVGSERLSFRFRGKGGRFHRIEYRDRRMARIVRSIQDLRGQALFQYLDEEGQIQAVSSTDVNDYLRQASGQDFTAKEFRTWRATIEAMRILRCLRQDGKLTKRRVNETICLVSQLLGNTPTICRKSYVHPRLLAECAEDPEWLVSRLPRAKSHLEPVERLAIEKLL